VAGSYVEEAIRELRRLGISSLYEAWKCAEHGECPPGVKPSEVDSLLFMAVVELEKRGMDPTSEWERRYMEELEAEKKRQRLPVPA